MLRLTRLTMAALLLPWLLLACGGEPEVHVLDGHAMGTRYQLRLAEPVADMEGLRVAITEELADIDRQLSTWRDDSEISRFNHGAGTDPWPVAGAFLAVLDKALALSRDTEGALDITLRPLALAWGFQGEGPPRVPSDAALRSLRAHTGMHLLERTVSSGGVTLRKRDARVEIDLSAVAKGYAVDRLAARAREAGARNFLVEIGGEVRAGGQRPGGGAWRVAVEPVTPNSARQVLVLENEAVATSGDYRNYFEVDGRRYAHVLDPATGRPAANGTAGATVVAGDAATADGLATAFLVMAPERAQALAEQLGVGLKLELRNGDRVVTHMNRAFETHLAPGQ